MEDKYGERLYVGDYIKSIEPNSGHWSDEAKRILTNAIWQIREIFGSRAHVNGTRFHLHSREVMKV